MTRGRYNYGEAIVLSDDNWIGLGSSAARILFDDQSTDEITFANCYVGIGNIDPTYKFSIGSTDDSDQIGIYHNNTSAYFKWTDGVLYLETDEGDNSTTYVWIRGKGTGSANLRLYDQDNAEYIQLSCISGWGDVQIVGNAPNGLRLQDAADADIKIFGSAAAGETQEVKIYGYRTGDASRSLQIGVGVDIADTASFDGLSNYLFDGNIMLGAAGVGADADNCIVLGNTSGPSASIGNGVHLYAHDYATSHSCLHIRNEDGNIIKLEQQNKADYNNWTDFGDVVDALVAMGIFDTA